MDGSSFLLVISIGVNNSYSQCLFLVGKDASPLSLYLILVMRLFVHNFLPSGGAFKYTRLPFLFVYFIRH